MSNSQVGRTVSLRRVNPSTVIIETPKYWLLFSYETLVAYDNKEDGIIYITDEKFGNTTTTQINKFVGGRWQKQVMEGVVKVVKQKILEAMV